jgi:hypothetical protein
LEILKKIVKVPNKNSSISKCRRFMTAESNSGTVVSTVMFFITLFAAGTAVPLRAYPTRGLTLLGFMLAWSRAAGPI